MITHLIHIHCSKQLIQTPVLVTCNTEQKEKKLQIKLVSTTEYTRIRQITI